VGFAEEKIRHLWTSV